MLSIKSISFALKQARLEQKLTQQELATKANVSRVWLVGLESGASPHVEFGKVLDVASALGLEFHLTPSKQLTPDERHIMRELFDA
ncbi:hypothetical protein FACS1894104_5180 [Actinomycetota bacterium]|nr:hypothetical protein FACS1894104_5180 [Actinomycetota bacterium]